MSDDLAIPAFLDRTKQRPFIWTFSNLNCYDSVCGYQFYRRYIKKDLGPFVESPAIKEGNAIHTAFELRVGGGKVLPDSMRQWEHFATPFDALPAVEVEMKLGVTADGKPTGFFDSDVAGRGKADVVVINENKAGIWDWKGGANSKYEKPFELEIHALMLKIKHPQLDTIVGSYVWLKENRMSQPYDLSDFNSTWARVNNIVEAIKNDMADEQFEKRKGPLCGFCDVLDCENNRKGK